jgi:hypothetical protein
MIDDCHPLQQMLRVVHRSYRGFQRINQRAAEELATIDMGQLTEELRRNVKKELAAIAASEGLLIEFRKLERSLRRVLRGPRAEWDKAAVAAKRRCLALLKRVRKAP